MSTAGIADAPVGEVHGQAKPSFWVLALGSVGVVYGDIGTSPLYAVKESLTAAKGSGALEASMIVGVISLILWALTIVVTLKYVILLLRADNNGEGGTLTLMALAHRATGGRGRYIVLLGVAGAALFYGDAVITPAISVLSAVEGLSLLTPAFTPYVLPLSLFILIALFAFQSRGTAKVAALFGPLIVVWMAALAIGGLNNISERPEILSALNPWHGASFIAHHGIAGFVALGAVFLAVTGAEALYADLGHFGRGPIRAAWLALVFPSLALNYLGQGALMLAKPEALENPFFLMYPEWALLPMVILATIATVIASQAVITGAYSMTQQAIQLGLVPRLRIRQTSAAERGQIYMPTVNWMLLIGVFILTATFKSSSTLAAAYGIAVTGTMLITVLLAFVVAHHLWKWPLWTVVLVLAPFLALDLVFLSANLMKIAEGGWLPLLIGGSLMIVALTWRRGSYLLSQQTKREELDLRKFLPTLEARGPGRVHGTAVFMTSHPENVPTSLLHNLKHNKILHETNIIVSLETADTPRVRDEERSQFEQLTQSFTVVRLRFGYMEEPNVPKALAACVATGLQFKPAQASYYLSRRALRPSARSKMPRWQDRLFVALARRASDASEYFMIPTEQVIEVGTQIVI